MSHRLPWFSESEPFERFCLHLWRLRDTELHWARYGRSGHKQDGIDVLGQGERTVVVQCKARDRFLGSRLTVREIDREIEKILPVVATNRLSVDTFYIATTSPRTPNLTDHCAARSRELPFPVFCRAWDDLEEDLAQWDHDGKLLATHWPQFRSKGLAARLALVEDMRESFVGLKLVPLRAPSDAEANLPAPVPSDPTLAQVFTMLDVNRTVGADARDPGDVEGPVEGRGTDLGGDPLALARLSHCVEQTMPNGRDARRPATVLEAAGAIPRLALGGVGGSGKSTFARYLALCLSGQLLDRADRRVPEAERAGLKDLEDDVERPEPAWNAGPLVPLWIELRDLVAWDGFPQTRDDARRSVLWEYLRTKRSVRHWRLSREHQSDLQSMMSGEDFGVPGVVLLLDGLDEVPDREQKAPLVVAVLEGFLEMYPQCRVVLTGRPYALDEDSMQQVLVEKLGFERVDLAPLSPDMVRRFLGRWFRARLDDDDRADEAAGHVARYLGTPALRELAQTPLLVTLVADLYGEEEPQWDRRADVLDSAVTRLVDVWNSARGLDDAQEITQDAAALRRSMEGAAAAAQQTDGVVRPERLEDCMASEGLPVAQTRGRWVLRDGGLDLLLYLERRCGILEPVAGGFAFPLRPIREFLAARWFERRDDFPRGLLAAAGWLIEPPDLQRLRDWRDVLLFAGSVASRRDPLRVWSMVDHLVPDALADDVRPDDPRFAAAWAAGEIVLDCRLHEGEPLRRELAADRAKRKRLCGWLSRCLEVGALSILDRAAVGRVLGALGDGRPGVGLAEEGLPDIEWCDVELPDGRVMQIARYPVTNAQYAAFVDDGGYTEQWRACWTNEGWQWRGERSGPDDGVRDVFLTPNHPRCNVTLHEAVAFARWLARRTKPSIQLPERGWWEHAATGGDGRDYPWEGPFDGKRCNGLHTGIGSTCAVGMFPGGRSPFGVDDLSGNVLEWQLLDGDPAGIKVAGLGGGSWLYDPDRLRVAARDRIGADYSFENLGFRVAVAPASPSTP